MARRADENGRTKLGTAKRLAVYMIAMANAGLTETEMKEISWLPVLT